MFRQLFEFEDFFLSNSGVELGQDKENIIACKKKKSSHSFGEALHAAPYMFTNINL